MKVGPAFVEFEAVHLNRRACPVLENMCDENAEDKAVNAHDNAVFLERNYSSDEDRTKLTTKGCPV